MHYKEALFFEMVYPGMIGIMEIAQFMRKASPQERKTFTDLIQRNQNKEAWALISKVLGIKLPDLK